MDYGNKMAQSDGESLKLQPCIYLAVHKGGVPCIHCRLNASGLTRKSELEDLIRDTFGSGSQIFWKSDDHASVEIWK